MAKERFSASVSFEYDLAPVRTAKYELHASSANSAARMAVKQARQELAPTKWRSMVVVLERLGAVAVDNAA